MRKNLFLVTILSALFIAALQAPSFALWPMHPDEVRRLKAEGKYDSMMQQWFDYKDKNKIQSYNFKQMAARPDNIVKIKETLRGTISKEKADVDLDLNGVVDERDLLELGYPVKRSAQSYRAPSLGVQKSIVILVDFNDRQGNPDYGTQYFNRMLFSQKEMSTPSMREYFAETSRDQVDCIGTVADSGVNGGWFRINANASDYFGFDNAPYVIERAVQLADPYIDFSEFDNSKEGFVESLIVIVAGPRDWNTFWPHKYYTYGAIAVDGVYIYPYFLSTEDSRMGTFAHEHGHAMGLPDLYDYDSSSYGVGFWCLMGYGCYGGDQYVPVHPNAWCKSLLGWINPIDVHSGFMNTAIPGTPDTNTVYKIMAHNGNLNNEFFIVENRRRQGYDAYLPGDGILIWHIDLYGNQDTDTRRRCDLEEADGYNDIDTKVNWGDGSDPFYFESGHYKFTDYTYPSAYTNFGKPSNISILDISNQGDPMYATLIYNPLCPGGVIPVQPDFMNQRP